MANEKQSLFEKIKGGFGYILKPEILQKLQEPFELSSKPETTEFKEPKIDVQNVDAIVSSGYFLTQFVDEKSSLSTINELIIKYRLSSSLAYINQAINEIVNESVIRDEVENVVIQFNEKSAKIGDTLKKKITEEFYNILDLLNWDDDGDELFRKWYIDGRLLIQVVLEPKNLKKGIVELKTMSPLFLKRVFDKDKKEYYYIYDTRELQNSSNQQILGKIPDELVILTPSGLYEGEKRTPVSWIHYALRDINRLDILEDHMLIYRIVRSPERRVFYIDVGNMPPKQAEMYMQKVINSYKQKKTLDDTTGFLAPKTKHPSILEDFFLMRRNGKGTEIDTLPSVGGLESIEDLKYFQNKALQAMNVPFSRLNFDDRQENVSMSLTNNDITREELKFLKFITRLQGKFSILFLQLLRKQLIYKNIIKPEEWKEIKRKINFKWKQDSVFVEAKKLNNLQARLNILRDVQEYQGTYFSSDYIWKQILGMSDKEIDQMKIQIQADKAIIDNNDVNIQPKY
jgi:uncharacterized protein YajQ (UPF0234 family)